VEYDYIAAQSQAERDFQKARNQAFWSTVWARIRGESTELLSFEEVRQKLRLGDERYMGRQEIPLDHIVGSVGRYQDFTRKFLPKKSVNRDRWKAVDALTLGSTGFPPIEVYKVGNAYFVLDGNHRVSVAQANGMTYIEAYVTEWITDVPFDIDTKPEDLFIKEGLAYFLRQTKLKSIRPDSDVVLTEPSRYPTILSHIEVHHYFMGLNCQCPVTWIEAVGSWYDKVYMPMVMGIRKHNMLADFPDRTEADLYVWLIQHQAEMREAYGGDPMSPEDTVEDFIDKTHISS
jgi:hypothetical protein